MTTNFNKYIEEVEDALKHLSNNNEFEKQQKLKNYIGTNLNVLGLVSKVQMNVYKKGFSFNTKSKETTFSILNNLFQQSKIFEAKNIAFIFLDKNYKYIPKDILLNTLINWVKYVDNWAHSDSLSKYISRLVECEFTREKILSILRDWNKSKNLWERRQSIIPLFYYSRTKKKHIEFELIHEFITPLLADNEYYVQKAIGWTLRESYSVYPNKTYDFIYANIYKITPIAFTTCIEKMPENQKNKLKQLRKK